LPVNEREQHFAAALAYADLDEAFEYLAGRGEPVTLEAALAYAYEAGLPLNAFEAYVENGRLKEEYSFANDWVIESVTNQNTDGGTGLYALIIDAGDSNILACRGSEDMKEFRNVEQDWLGADLGMLNSTMTEQEEALRIFMETNADLLTDKPWVSTGHSLGGALADYAAIMSVELGLDNYAGTINFDGPGHSQEFIKKYADEIAQVCDKMKHRKASIVGNMLYDLPGVEQKFIETENVGVLYQHNMHGDNWHWENGELKEGKQSAVEYLVEKFTRGGDRLPAFVGDSVAKTLVAVITGVYWLTEFAEDHPLLVKTITVAVCGFLLSHPGLVALGLGAVLKIVSLVVVFVALVIVGEIICEFLEKVIREIAEAICAAVNWLRDKAVALYHGLVEMVQSLRQYFRSITPGGRYVANNPYFKADTESLRNYAARMDSVNRRLVQLDKDLNSLYWQVGLLDLAEIISADVITTYSANLLLAKTFLNNTANMLERADRKALSYFSG
jgi:hypothetical protein